MAAPVTASSQPLLNISYSLSQLESTDSETDTTIEETTDAGFTDLFYNNGTGIGEINLGVKTTGYLASGGTTYFDITEMPKEIFYGSITGNFTLGVKAFITTNLWLPPSSGITAGELPYFTIQATGTNAFTNLFSNGSGNINVTPQSTWGVTNYVGFFPNENNKLFSFVDSGSGVPYELLIVGVTGTG